MTYVLDQTGAELREHMRRITDTSGWDDPLATRLWAEVQALDAEIARLRHQDNPPASSEAGLADHEAVPLRSALVHFFKQFRQSVFAEYHGTGAEPYRERGFSDGCWFDTESARLLVALDQMPASSYETALADIVAWSEAYPKTVFLQPDYAKAHEALQAVGMTLDAISADIMRTALDEVGKRARSALGASDHPPASSGKVQLVEMDEIWTFKETRKYLLSEIERLRDDLHAVGKNLTGEQPEAVSCLDTAYGRTANISSILSNAPTATQIPASSDPAALAEQEEGDA